MSEICYFCFSPSAGETVCPYCGCRARKPDEGRHMNPGAVLRERYIVGYVFSIDSVSITYYGYDRQLNKQVWVREYLPEGLAGRQEGDPAVRLMLDEAKAYFEKGKALFSQRARELAQFNTQMGMAKMECYLEENGTGYIIMDRPAGKALPEYMKEHGGRLDWFEALQVMNPVMDLLQKIHDAGMIHGYVSPGNIFMTDEGQGILLNFNMIEQDMVPANIQYLPQGLLDGKRPLGPWVDVYAVAASLYHIVTGEQPSPGFDYLTGQVQLTPPSQKGAILPQRAEEVLMQVLKRAETPCTASIEEFERGLLGLESAQRRREKPSRRPRKERTPRPDRSNLKKWIWLGPVLGIAAAFLVIVVLTGVRYFGAEKLYRDGMDALRADRTGDAVACFKAAMDRFPIANQKYEDIYHQTKGMDFYKQARKAMEWGSYEEAINLYGQAIKEDPHNKEYSEGLRAAEKFKEGYLLYDKGQFARAKLSFQASLEIDPSNSYISGLIAGIDAWSEGRDAFYDEDYEAAYNAYSKALEYDEDNAYYLSLCEEANNKWQASEKADLALFYYEIGEFIYAYEAIVEAAELDAEYEEYVDAFYVLAEIEFFYEVLLEKEYMDDRYLSLSKITKGPNYLTSVSTLPTNWGCMCVYVESPKNMKIQANLYLIDGLSEDDRILLGWGDDHALGPDYGLWIHWENEYPPGNYCIEVIMVQTGEVISREYVRVLSEEE